MSNGEVDEDFEESVVRLHSLGYELQSCRQALQNVDGNFDDALDYLMDLAIKTSTIQTRSQYGSNQAVGLDTSVMDDEDSGDGDVVDNDGLDNEDTENNFQSESYEPDPYNYDDFYDDENEIVESSPGSLEANIFEIPPNQCKFMTLEELEPLLRYVEGRSMLGDNVDISEAILLKNKWDIEKSQEKYFENMNATLTEAGMLGYDSDLIDSRLKASEPIGKSITCCICFCDYDESESFALCCNHWTCKSCFSTYLKTCVESSDVVHTHCPGHKCSSKVCAPVFKSLCSPENYDRYIKFILHDFVDKSKDKRWCPGVGCERICIGNAVDTVKCECGTQFCFKCCEIEHEPASCEQVINWRAKSKEEGPNILWIENNTKKCPKCKQNIEKNEGCNHMTCSKLLSCSILPLLWHIFYI